MSTNPGRLILYLIYQYTGPDWTHLARYKLSQVRTLVDLEIRSWDKPLENNNTKDIVTTKFPIHAVAGSKMPLPGSMPLVNRLNNMLEDGTYTRTNKYKQ